MTEGDVEVEIMQSGDAMACGGVEDGQVKAATQRGIWGGGDGSGDS